MIAEPGTYFDQEDISDFFSLSLPGLDELMAVLHVLDLLDDHKYDLVVLDTAPTGHTLRLLALPEGMDRWAQVLDHMYEKHRYLAATFGGRYRPDEADHFLQRMRTDVARVRATLTNPARTRVIPVLVPEPMVVAETRRLLAGLDSRQVPSGPVVVNRVAPAAGCSFCSARRAAQAPHLQELVASLGGRSWVEVSLFAGEVRGIASLERFADVLFAAADPAVAAPTVTAPTRPSARPADARPVSLAGLLAGSPRLLIFGGKGGVGKTTVAAATAVRLAQSGRRTLLLSIDPAHSVADALGTPVGRRITPVARIPGLCALEADADDTLEDLKSRYAEEIAEVFERFVGGHGVDVAFDRQVMEELISLTPPGLDEVMALLIMDLLEEGQQEVLVLDSAPSGHLLRFLELPGIAGDWFRTFLKLLFKYREVAPLEKTTQRLLALARGVSRLQKRLVDPGYTRFAAVTIPETMGLLETEDPVVRLRELQVSCGYMVVNMVLPPTGCTFCTGVRMQQQERLAELAAGFPEVHITTVPLYAHPLQGVNDLADVALTLYGTIPGSAPE